MKYEYTLMFFKISSGKCVGKLSETYTTLDSALNRAREFQEMHRKFGEEVRVARREVGEWEVK